MVTNDIVTSTSVVDSATETAVGNVLSVKGFTDLSFWVDYTNGNEDGVRFYFYGLRTSSGDEYPLTYYQNIDGVRTQQSNNYIEYTATGKKAPIQFNVAAVAYVKVYQTRKGATTPTGSFDLSYLKDRSF